MADLLLLGAFLLVLFLLHETFVYPFGRKFAREEREFHARCAAAIKKQRQQAQKDAQNGE